MQFSQCICMKKCQFQQTLNFFMTNFRKTISNNVHLTRTWTYYSMSSIFNIISSLHIILNDDIKVVVFAQMQILPFSVQLIQRFIMFAAFKHGNKLCITAKPSSEEKKTTAVYYLKWRSHYTLAFKESNYIILINMGAVKRNSVGKINQNVCYYLYGLAWLGPMIKLPFILYTLFPYIMKKKSWQTKTYFRIKWSNFMCVPYIRKICSKANLLLSMSRLCNYCWKMWKSLHNSCTLIFGKACEIKGLSHLHVIENDINGFMTNM